MRLRSKLAIAAGCAVAALEGARRIRRNRLMANFNSWNAGGIRPITPVEAWAKSTAFRPGGSEAVKRASSLDEIVKRNKYSGLGAKQHAHNNFMEGAQRFDRGKPARPIDSVKRLAEKRKKHKKKGR